MGMIQFTQDKFEHRYKRMNGIWLLEKAIFRKGNPASVELTMEFIAGRKFLNQSIKFANYRINLFVDKDENLTGGSEVDFTTDINKCFWMKMQESTTVKLSVSGTGQFDFLLVTSVIK